MNIKFEKVQLHNFLSFEDAEIQLNDNGFTLVKGVNLNVEDNALSNGSGKSSIWESISWALTGETIRGAKDVKRLGSEGTCSVTITFTVDNDTYEITRTKDPSNLKIVVNGEDKSGKGIRDTEKILEQYLPDLTSSLIGSVIILGQGLPQRFTNNSPSGRKDVLEKLSKSDFMIEDLKARIQRRKNELTTLVREIEDALLVSNTKKSVSTKNLETAKAKLSGLEATDTNALKTQLDSLLYLGKASAEAERDKALADMETIRARLNEANKKTYSLKAELAEKQKQVSETFSSRMSPINEAISGANTECTMLQQQITKIQNIKDICPTCGQKLQGVEKPSTTELEEQLSSAQAKLAAKKAEYAAVNTEYNSEVSKVNDEYKDAISTSSAEVFSITSELSSKEAEYRTKCTSISQIDTQVTALQRQLESFDKEYEATKQVISQSEADIATFEREILYNNSRKDDAQQHMDVVNKMATIITRDFRGYLLTNVIDYINKRAKAYSEEIFGTDKVNFIQNGNNISISYCGKESESLSGGERQKLDLIVQFAIRDMLCNYLDFSCNILVLDEIADNIDSMGAEKLFSTIATKISDVDSIYIISHHQDFDMPVDKEIIITKGADGISRVN